ncbi:MAG: PQQ-binding-like beta-propeller repeat protein [Armatimonadota bacterium]|nr:PQQ-binding-like beta-propeller repeat protein [Armatimonadota bacterium]
MKTKPIAFWLQVALLSSVMLRGTVAVAQSPWPMWGGDRFHTRSTTIVGPSQPTFKWKAYVGGAVRECSIGADGNIYAPNSSGALTAVSPGGGILWQRAGAGGLSGYATAAVGPDGNLYSANGNYAAASYSPNGELRWSSYNQELARAPTIAADGSIWTSRLKLSANGDAIGPSYSESRTPVSEARAGGVYAGDIYTTTATPGSLGAGVLKTQRLQLNAQGQWYWATAWSFEASMGPSHFGTPAVAENGNVIVAWSRDAVPLDGKIRAFSPAGASLWTVGVGAYPELAIGSDGTIYAHGGQQLWAINPDGSIRWTTDLGVGANAPLVVDGAGTVYVRTSSGLIAVASNGAVSWNISVGQNGSPSGTPLFGADGTMYVGSVDGFLYAYAPVPEPASALGLAAGLFALVPSLRRRGQR